MAPSAARASPGWVSMTYWPYPAWTAMTLMLCATTSCSSLAMRRRSCVTAWLAASSRSLTAYPRRWRTMYPVAQTTMTKSAIEIGPPQLNPSPERMARSTTSARRVTKTAARTQTASCQRS
jgi:hypothetical protein